jgi:hypothetical protein
VAFDPQTPEWWLTTLYDALMNQRRHFDLMDAYYRGEPPRLPWLPEQAQNDLRRLIALTKSNYMGLVVDSMVERMQIEGFRLNGESIGDQQTWAIWQANNMDSGSDQVLLEAAIAGCSYIQVSPNNAEPARPVITPEHPAQTIVAYEPGTARRRRAAALKVWRDEWTGHMMATLYLPSVLFKWEAEKSAQPTPGYGTPLSDMSRPNWVPRMVASEQWPAPNPLGVVPIVEIPNNPRLLTGGVSEIADVITIQDRVNKTLADRLMTQDYGAFPQKWATGYQFEDDDGNEQDIGMQIGRARVVTAESAETKFGQWDAAAIDPYSAAKREDVKDIASRTRTPAQYLLGEMSNVNGETLKASESGLVSKVRQRQRTAGEGVEETVRLTRRAAGLSGADEAMEIVWRNPEFRTEGELVDALTKMKGLGVPEEALWERWGASQVEIERWKEQRAEQTTLDPMGTLSRLATQQPDGDVIDGDAGNGR